jgi:predicted enzyme related to lactoylglutathione lyase
MEMETYAHGVPSWVDLSTPDLAGARAFYADLFGWDTPEGPPETGGYSVAMLRGRAVAGIGPQMNPAMPPFWMTYVNVDDAHAVVELVKANGGQVMVEPMAILDVGTMAVFMDPIGAAFAIWQPQEHKGAGLVNEPNTYAWSELISTDVPASKAFYGSVFGWGNETQGSEGPGGYTEWKLDGRSIGGLMAKAPEMPAEMPPLWGVYFTVADVDAATEKVAELGGAKLMGPMDIEPGRFSVVADPSGATFNLMTLKEGMGG